MKTGRLEAIAKGLSLRAPLKTPDLPRPRSTLMNALSRFFVGVSTLFCLVVLCPSTGFAVSANANTQVTWTLSGTSQEVPISDTVYCEEGEFECECPNGYIVSATVKRTEYSLRGQARHGCSYSGEESSTSKLTTRLDPYISLLSSCEVTNKSSEMNCGAFQLGAEHMGRCITLEAASSCEAWDTCYDSEDNPYTCSDYANDEEYSIVKIPPNIDAVELLIDSPCEPTDYDCQQEHEEEVMRSGNQNSLTVGQEMTIRVYVYALWQRNDTLRAKVSGAGVNKSSSIIVDELPDRWMVLEVKGVKPTKVEDVKIEVVMTRNGCETTSSPYYVSVKNSDCIYPISQAELEEMVRTCKYKYFFYDPARGCESMQGSEEDGGFEDSDDASGNFDTDFDYDAGIVEDFDAAIDWDAGVGEEEDDVDDGDGADSGATDAGSSDNQNPDEPNLDAGTTDADGGAFSSGNGDPNNGGENSGQGGNGGSGSGSDAGSGSGGSSDSDAGFTGGIGLPSVDEFVDGGTGDGSGDGSGSGDEGPDSEFTGGDTGFSGGASGDLGDSSADGNGNGNGSGSGNGSGTGTGGSGNGSGSGGQGSGEAPEGGTGFTGGTGFPGGAGFDGYDWGSGDSQGETTPSAPGSGDGSGSGSGNGSGTGDGSGSGSGNGSGTGDGSGSGSGNGSGTGDGSGNGSGNGSGTGDGSGSGSGNGSGTGDGSGNGSGNGSGTGDGSGSGSGNGSGTGDGSGSGSGNGSGTGDGSGNGSGNGSGTGDGSGNGSGNGSGTGDGSGSGSGNGSGTGDGSGNGSGNGSGTGDGSGSGSGNGSGTGDGSGNGSGNGSGTGDGSGSGSGNGSGTGDGSGNGSGNQQFSLTGGVQKESTVTGCGGCSGSGASFLLGWLGLALLPALRRRKRG